jgi:tRNA-binding protein
MALRDESEPMHVTHDPAAGVSPTIDFNTFLALDIRVGTIVDAQPFPKARKPSWRLWIDFGPVIGVRKSSAQITENHPLDSLLGQQVAAVVNFPPRQIGPMISEVLTLGSRTPTATSCLCSPASSCPTADVCSSVAVQKFSSLARRVGVCLSAVGPSSSSRS